MSDSNESENRTFGRRTALKLTGGIALGSASAGTAVAGCDSYEKKKKHHAKKEKYHEKKEKYHAKKKKEHEKKAEGTISFKDKCTQVCVDIKPDTWWTLKVKFTNGDTTTYSYDDDVCVTFYKSKHKKKRLRIKKAVLYEGEESTEGRKLDYAKCEYEEEDDDGHKKHYKKKYKGGSHHGKKKREHEEKEDYHRKKKDYHKKKKDEHDKGGHGGDHKKGRDDKPDNGDDKPDKPDNGDGKPDKPDNGDGKPDKPDNGDDKPDNGGDSTQEADIDQKQVNEQTNKAGYNSGSQTNVNSQEQDASVDQSQSSGGSGDRSQEASIDQTQVNEQTNVAGVNTGSQTNVNSQSQSASINQSQN